MAYLLFLLLLLLCLLVVLSILVVVIGLVVAGPLALLVVWLVFTYVT